MQGVLSDPAPREFGSSRITPDKSASVRRLGPFTRHSEKVESRVIDD